MNMWKYISIKHGSSSRPTRNCTFFVSGS